MALVIYHVLPYAGGGWSVKRSAAKRSSGTYVTKSLALRAASRLAKAHPTAQVVIHNAAGTIVGDRLFTSATHQVYRKKKARVRKMRKTIERKERRAQRLRSKHRSAAKKGLRGQRQQRLKRSQAARTAANRRR